MFGVIGPVATGLRHDAGDLPLSDFLWMFLRDSHQSSARAEEEALERGKGEKKKNIPLC